MAYNLGPASRFDDGISLKNKVGIFLEDSVTPAGQSSEKGSIVLNQQATKAEVWLKRDTADIERWFSI